MKTPSIADISSEKLVEMVVKSVYEGEEKNSKGTKVQGVKNLVIGEPVGGWTCNAVIITRGELDTLECVYDGERYRDRVVGQQAQAIEEQQTDASDLWGYPIPRHSQARRTLDIVLADTVRIDNLDEELLAMLSQETARELVTVAATELYTQRGHAVDVAVDVAVDSVHVDDGALLVMLRLDGDDGPSDALVTYRDGLWQEDRVDIDELLESLLGWRVDAPKGGKGGRKKRTEKPKCTKGRSCGMSCIPQNRKCKSTLSTAADAVAKSVATASTGNNAGKQKQRKTQPKAINLTPLGGKIQDTYLANAKGLNNIGDVFKPGADTIESNARPDPKLVAAFRQGQKNGTLAMMRFNEQENVVPVDPVSAVIMASAKAAGVSVNGLIVRDEDSGLAAALQKVNGAPLMTTEGRGSGMNNIGGMQRVTASEITPGRVTASQRDIDAAARAIREQGGRAVLPIPVREAKDGSGYSVVGNGNLLAVAQRANVDPWIYIVDEQ